MKCRAKLLAVAFVATLGGGAGAQVPDVAIARQLAIQGVEAVESGNCKDGVQLLERAEKMHHAPVHLQFIARCRYREGRLVMATELWRQIAREGAPAGASPALVNAVAEANAQLQRTLPRLARTTFRTTGEYPGLELRLDGTVLPQEILGGSQLLDPGPHELTATAPGYTPWQRGWTLTEGGNAEIVVTLAAAEGTPGPGPAVATGEGSGAGYPPWFGTAGWITASTGAAALVGGTVALLARNSRRNELESDCPNKECRDMEQAELDDRKSSIEGLTTAANVLFFGGGVLLAGGVTLIVLDKTSKSSGDGAAVVAGSHGALGGLTFRGRF